MTWKQLTEYNSVVQVFHLKNVLSTVAVMYYSNTGNSVKISCRGHLQAFSLVPGVLRPNNFIIKNEYGVRCGRILLKKFPNGSGNLRLGNMHFEYYITGSRQKSLVLYDADAQVPISVFQFSLKEDSGLSMRKLKSKQSFTFAALLTATCCCCSENVFDQHDIPHSSALLYAV